MTDIEMTFSQDYLNFFATTGLRNEDLIADMAIYAILWQRIFKNRNWQKGVDNDVYMLTLPFVLKYRDKLQAEGKWPKDEEGNLKYCALLTAIFTAKGADIPADKLAEFESRITQAALEMKL